MYPVHNVLFLLAMAHGTSYMEALYGCSSHNKQRILFQVHPISSRVTALPSDLKTYYDCFWFTLNIVDSLMTSHARTWTSDTCTWTSTFYVYVSSYYNTLSSLSTEQIYFTNVTRQTHTWSVCISYHDYVLTLSSQTPHYSTRPVGL